MLENRLESKQNMYIHVENFTQTTFHLYEDKYPTQAHYKIFILVNESSITMQKCVDLKSCKPMVDCYNGVSLIIFQILLRNYLNYIFSVYRQQNKNP